jgi:peptidoglycan endopeptidase LytE
MRWNVKHVIMTSVFASALFMLPMTGKAVEWKLGMSHPQIKQLQQQLKQLGYFTSPQITGYYGTVTLDAVKKFQKANGLAVTGVADSRTVQTIQKVLNRRVNSSTNKQETVLRIGSKGSEVSKLQQQLKLLGYFTYPQITDYYSTMTSDAVKKFQRKYGLRVTGVADSKTLAKIREVVDKNKNKTKNTIQPTPISAKPTIYLTIGSTGPQVEEVQAKLKQLGHFTHPTITGYFGQVTAEAVKKFQQSANLNVTGIVDNETYVRLMGQAPAKKLDVIELIADATKLLGTPYVWGGETPEAGFDCSGFIVYLFKQQGLTLPRTVALMWDAGTKVETPSVGDMVFFQTDGPGASHVGIYIGNNQFIHSGSSTGVTISSLNSSYWSAHYVGAKRYYVNAISRL